MSINAEFKLFWNVKPYEINASFAGKQSYIIPFGSMIPNFGGSGGGDVLSVNGKKGHVTLDANDVDAYSKQESDDLLNTKQDTLPTNGDGSKYLSDDGTYKEIQTTVDAYTKAETDTLLDAKANASDISVVGYSNNYNDLDNKPTNISAFNNDVGYLTQHQDISGKVDKTTEVVAGTGLSGGGNLSANRTLSVIYGTTAGTVAQGNDTRIVNAVQKEVGKGLSTNDYTNIEKTKVSKIVTDGAGDKYLSDDGSYKSVSGGGGGVSEVDVKGWIARNIAVGSVYNTGVVPPNATHSESISIGSSAASQGNNSIQIGKSANSNRNSVAIGTSAKSLEANSVAIGNVAAANGGNCVSIGNNAKSNEGNAIAIGFQAVANNFDAISIGRDSVAQQFSISIGYKANNSNNTHTNCVLLGSNTVVTSANQVQLGDSATTTYAYGAVQDRSDIRDKTDIRDIALGLDFINKLRPVEYKWDYREDYFADVAPKREDFDSDEEYSTAYEQARATFFENPIKDGSKTRVRHHTGLIAQEVKQAMDDLGVDFGGFQHHQEKGGLDVMSLGYNELIAVLIKAVQELDNKLKALT